MNASDDEAHTEGNGSRPTSTANKAGIRLSKPGYYMFPTLEELDDLIDDNGRCVVQDLVIGRQVRATFLNLSSLLTLPFLILPYFSHMDTYFSPV